MLEPLRITTQECKTARTSKEHLSRYPEDQEFAGRLDIMVILGARVCEKTYCNILQYQSSVVGTEHEKALIRNQFCCSSAVRM